MKAITPKRPIPPATLKPMIVLVLIPPSSSSVVLLVLDASAAEEVAVLDGVTNVVIVVAWPSAPVDVVT